VLLGLILKTVLMSTYIRDGHGGQQNKQQSSLIDNNSFLIYIKRFVCCKKNKILIQLNWSVRLSFYFF